MRRHIPVVLVALVAGLSICALKTPAFQNPLSAEAITEAYYLGKGDGAKRAAFFQKYTHQFGVPDEGPQIASIELETPFACVVDQIARNSANFHEPDAQERFLGKPAEFKIRAVAYLTATWPKSSGGAPVLHNFWNRFEIHLKQAGSAISPRSVVGTPIYSQKSMTGYIGATIVTDYDAERIKSGLVTVIVNGPDNAHVESEFDLSKLR